MTRGSGYSGADGETVREGAEPWRTVGWTDVRGARARLASAVPSPIWRWLGLAVILAVLGFVTSGQWKVTLGIAAGVLFGTLAWMRESPPARIQNWRWGSEGERKTAKALKRLPRADWKVWHDLQWEDKSNIDHVVVGSAGVFLVDTKDCFGHVTVDEGGLHFQWLEDPDIVTGYRGIFAKEGSASAALKEYHPSRDRSQDVGNARGRDVGPLRSGSDRDSQGHLRARERAGRVVVRAAPNARALRSCEGQRVA